MTAQAQRAPRLPQSGPAAVTNSAKVFTMADISTKVDTLPNRYCLHSREGWGKTSLAAQTPRPIFIETCGETGLETLIEAGQLPETPHFPAIDSWEELLAAITFLKSQPHGFATLVLDTVNGAERLCYEYVCKRDFNGDWGDRGFGGYQRGYEVSLAEWRMFLNSLDDLRRMRKMTIFFLVHTKIKTFKNPQGADYDRWAPDMHDKAWGLTHKWLDCVLFGNFEVTVKTAGRDTDPNKKGKALETSFRILYTRHHPAYDAKNRLGLPEEIDMGETPQEGWANLSSAIRSARKPQEVTSGE